MFTGIIRHLGEVVRVSSTGTGRRLWIRAPDLVAGLAEGDSVAVDGCCLSVEEMQEDGFRLFCTPETLNRTTMGRLEPGDAVNLELPLRPTDRLGGHFVQGHVDGVGTVREVRELGGSWLFGFEAPPAVARYLVEKGSVAVAGISLTVARLEGAAFEVAVIPETWNRTTLGRCSAGDPVNLEADLLAKYVERLLQPAESSSFEDAFRSAFDEPES